MRTLHSLLTEAWPTASLQQIVDAITDELVSQTLSELDIIVSNTGEYV